MDIQPGQKFGYLTTIEPSKTKNGRAGWLCRCVCGNDTVVKTHNLISGNTKSCGCMWHVSIGEKKRIHGEAGGVYEGERTALYRCWVNMRSRCYNQKVRSYVDYGAKGIRVCEDWMDFEKFAVWAYDNGYQAGLTIERKDPLKNYCPENCEWISLSENSKRAHRIHAWAMNLSTGEYYEFTGVKDFAREHDLSYQCISNVMRGKSKSHKDWIFGYLL